MTTDYNQTSGKSTMTVLSGIWPALPCPFCGGPARLFSWMCFGWYVQCMICGARAGRIQNEEKEAIEVWNRRAPTPTASPTGTHDTP